MIATGAGAAAQVGIQLANRAIKYAGQIAGIGVSGLFETLSVGDNPMGSIGNSWLGKLAGGLAGARPALPNLAGGGPDKGPSNQPLSPEAVAANRIATQGGNAANGVTNNINVTNQRATEDGTGRDIARHAEAIYAPAGRQ